MKTILIISSKEKSKEAIKALLSSYKDYQIITSSNAGDAMRLINDDLSIDISVINTPLSDEYGIDLAVHMSKNLNISTLIMVKINDADDIRSKVENAGVIVIEKPVSKELFNQAMKLQISVRNKILGLQSENAKLKSKIEEIKLVDRAKCLLIEKLKLSEEDAHKFIEKKAMDDRIPRGAIARKILSEYI